MDPLTHCLVGGMAAKTSGVSNRRFWIMLFLGAAPDLDVIFNVFGSWAFWLQHRGISHSFLGIAIQAVMYSYLFRKWDTGSSRQRTLNYMLPLSLHSACDFLTSHGVPLLSPFRFHEYSIDLMVGLAIVPIIFMSIGLMVLYLKGASGWNATRPLWAGWLLYFMMAVSGKAYAAKLLNVSGDQAATIPSVANPFVWAAVYPDPMSQTYKKFRLNLFNGVISETHTFMMPEKNFAVQASMDSPQVREFLQEARWPVARVSASDDGWIVEWGNILFSTRGVVRGKIQVIVGNNGEIINETKIFKFWNPPTV